MLITINGSNSHRLRTHSGFTIVELLIVIVVIGILAAITIVAFNGIQQRARASAATSALSQATKKIAVAQVDDSSLPTCSSFYTLITIKTSDIPTDTACSFTNGDVAYQFKQIPNSSNPTGYCITATNGNVSYSVTSSSSVPVNVACAGHGSGGADAITNIAANPRATAFASSAGPGWNSSRWAGGSPASASYTLVAGASDGPAGITTYVRKTWNTAPPALGNSGDTGFDNGPALVVAGGQQYVISCYVRPSVNRNFNIDVYQYSAPGVSFSIPRTRGASTSGPANQWTRVSYVYTVPSGVVRIGITCDSNADATNGASNWAVGSRLEGTGLMITSGSTLYNYADGNSSGWAWSLTENNSSSSGPPV